MLRVSQLTVGARVGVQLLLLVVFVAGLSGLSATQAPPAAAACSGSGCNGLNPSGNCSATSTPQELFFAGEITLQLRYSSTCRAFWGRAIADNCGDHPWPMYVRVQRQLYTPYGYYDTHVYYSGQVSCAGSPQWTPMVGNYDSDRQRSCFAFSPDGRAPRSMPEDWWFLCTDWQY
jgi:hypothetical protein